MEPLAARKGAEGRGGRPEQKDKGKEAGICSLWPLLQLVQEAEAKATECAVRSLIPSWGGGGKVAAALCQNTSHSMSSNASQTTLLQLSSFVCTCSPGHSHFPGIL